MLKVTLHKYYCSQSFRMGSVGCLLTHRITFFNFFKKSLFGHTFSYKLRELYTIQHFSSINPMPEFKVLLLVRGDLVVGGGEGKDFAFYVAFFLTVMHFNDIRFCIS